MVKEVETTNPRDKEREIEIGAKSEQTDQTARYGWHCRFFTQEMFNGCLGTDLEGDKIKTQPPK